MIPPNQEPEKTLDAYIRDYLVKRKYNATLEAFQAEAEVSTNINVIDAPGGFLYEWWSVFWDIFIARYRMQVPGAGVSSNEGQTRIVQEQEKQQQWDQKSPHQQQQENIAIQEVLSQRKNQQPKQQRRGPTLPQHGTTSDTRATQQGNSNISTMRVYQEGLKLPVQNDHLDDAIVRPRFSDSVGHLLDSNHATKMKSLAGYSRHTPHATSIGISGHYHPTNSKGITNIPLKGWPLTGQDNLRSRLQQQNPSMQSPRDLHQFMLQRQLMILQAQQNLPLGMLLNEQQNTGRRNDGTLISTDGSMNIDMLIKQLQMQNSHELQQQYQQGVLFSKQSQNSNYQDKTVGAGSIALEGSSSNSIHGIYQASKNRTGQKRKRPISSSGPANSSAIANTIGPFASSAPSTPLSHTPEDILSTPTLPLKEGFSRSSDMLGNNGGVTLVSASDQHARMNCFVGVRSLDDTVDTYVSHDGADRGVGTGITFSEIGRIHANQVDCCDLSSDGKVLVTAGNDKANIWCTDSLEQKYMLEEHSHAITDTRFSPTTRWLATCSLDKTVRVWDVENPGYSLHTFVGHSASVRSVDFHPNKEDLICSSDDINEIRYWSINNASCARVLKGGSTQVRFQPIIGRYIAAAVGNGMSIVDVETTQTCGSPFKGHTLEVESICWDFSGELLASVSEDIVKVWRIGCGAQCTPIHELRFSGKEFRCCVFHPHYPSLLVIGCSQSLELWNMSENKMMTPLGEPSSALAVSETTGLVASASQNNDIKMWKWI